MEAPLSSWALFLAILFTRVGRPGLQFEEFRTLPSVFLLFGGNCADGHTLVQFLGALSFILCREKHSHDHVMLTGWWQDWLGDASSWHNLAPLSSLSHRVRTFCLAQWFLREADERALYLTSPCLLLRLYSFVRHWQSVWGIDQHSDVSTMRRR